MRCIIYAIKEFRRNKGYIAIRGSDVFKDVPYLKHLWIPHLLHAEKLIGVTHMAGKKPPGKWWQELWWMLTARNYVMKHDDD